MPKKKLEYQYATPRHWQVLCFALNKGLDDRHDCNRDHVVNAESSPTYPTSAFTVDLSLKHSMGLGADPQQCMIQNYFVVDEFNPDCRTALRYNYPEFVYEPRYRELSPKNIDRYEFPFVDHEELVENCERRVFQLLNANMVDFADPLNRCQLADEASMNAPGHKRKSASAAYNQLVQVKRNRSSELTLETLRDLMNKLWDRNNQHAGPRERIQKLQRMPSNTEVVFEYSALLKKAWDARVLVQLQGIEKFKKLFTKDAIVPESIQMIAAYFQQWMRDNDGDVTMVREKWTQNLTTFHEVLAMTAIDLEVIFGVNTSHREIISCLISSMQVYFRTKFHCHVLFTGPPEAGKTYTLEKLFKMLIAGSAKMLAMSTPKAKTALSDKFSMMIEMYQEIPPSQLGVEQGRAKGSAGATNNTDAESLLKGQLTEGEISVQALAMIDGKRVLHDYKVDANCLVMVATNASADMIPIAMRNRFNHHQVSKSTSQSRILFFFREGVGN